jgi:hypothetical protein
MLSVRITHKVCSHGFFESHKTIFSWGLSVLGEPENPNLIREPICASTSGVALFYI